jgi:replicative DNA helicase
MAIDSIYALNIERAVLSSILYSPEQITDITDILKPSDFYLPAHKKIFTVMRQLEQEDLPIEQLLH